MLPHSTSFITILIAFVALSDAQVIHEDLIFEPQPEHGGNLFGTSLDHSGNLAISGAPDGRINLIQTGTVYIYDIQTGIEQHMFTGSDATNGSEFGHSVGIDGNYAVVGAPKFDGLYTYEGAAYIFDTQTGEEVHRLYPIDSLPFSRFGESVAISGDTILVGCPITNRPNGGAVFVYSATTGEIVRILSVDGLENGDGFGNSVGIHGDYAVVGAAGEDAPFHNSGAAYVFNIQTGKQVFKLLPEISEAGEFFGESVSISENRVIVGTSDGYVQGQRHGAAYLFDLETGQFITQIHQYDLDFGGDFGFDVDISGDFIVVGARGMAGGGAVSGAAYLFDARTGIQLGKLERSAPFITELIGTSVSIDGSNVVVGGPNTHVNHELYGANYCFYSPCPTDLNQDGSLSFSDAQVFVQNRIDWNFDNTFDFFDISNYLQAYRSGCP